MKTLILSLIATAAILTSTFAQAGQEIEKVLGQCEITKATVLKSKYLPKGSTELNEVANLSVTRTKSIINEGTDKATYYDESYLYFAGVNPKECPALGCFIGNISEMVGSSVPNGPKTDKYKFSSNSTEKLNLLLSEPGYTDWMRLTYDYKKATGKIEVRTKINEWGSTTINTHLVYEIANCNFQGPISLDVK